MDYIREHYSAFVKVTSFFIFLPFPKRQVLVQSPVPEKGFGLVWFGLCALACIPIIVTCAHILFLVYWGSC